MRRWHAERDLMLRRWRNEIAAHGGHSGWLIDDRSGWQEAPIPPPACDIDTCHCFQGPGYFRKRHPFDCGNPKCPLCHFEKFWMPKNRGNTRRKAIQFEYEAEGGGA